MFPDVFGSRSASAPEATADTEKQTLTVPGLVTLRGDDGTHGTLTDLLADFQSGLTTGFGPVDITYANGTTLQASGFTHDGTLERWTFSGVTLTYPDLPWEPKEAFRVVPRFLLTLKGCWATADDGQTNPGLIRPERCREYETR